MKQNVFVGSRIICLQTQDAESSSTLVHPIISKESQPLFHCLKKTQEIVDLGRYTQTRDKLQSSAFPMGDSRMTVKWGERGSLMQSKW